MLSLIVGADRGGLEPGRSHGNHGNGGVSEGTLYSTVQYSTVQYSVRHYLALGELVETKHQRPHKGFTKLLPARKP